MLRNLMMASADDKPSGWRNSIKKYQTGQVTASTYRWFNEVGGTFYLQTAAKYIVKSTDGEVWERDQVLTDLLVTRSLEYFEFLVSDPTGQHRVAGGYSKPEIYVSNDFGNSYTVKTLITSLGNHARAVYNNGRFIVSGGNTGATLTAPRVHYSDDNGATWTQVVGGTPTVALGEYRTIAVLGSTVMLVSNKTSATNMFYSTDTGTTWSYVTQPVTEISGCAYNSSTIVFYRGVNGTTIWSTDGLTWTVGTKTTATTTPATTAWGTSAASDLTWTGTEFVLVGAAGKVATSTDGKNFVSNNYVSKMGAIPTLIGVACANGKYVLYAPTQIGTYIGSTLDTLKLTARANVIGMLSSTSTNDIRSIAYGNGVYICAGTSGLYFYSFNGDDWYFSTSLAEAMSWNLNTATARTSYNSGKLMDMIFVEETQTFIGVGGLTTISGTVVKGTFGGSNPGLDGITWTAMNVDSITTSTLKNGNTTLHSIAKSNDESNDESKIVIGGDGGKLLLSTDNGNTFRFMNLATSGSPNAVTTVVWNAGYDHDSVTWNESLGVFWTSGGSQIWYSYTGELWYSVVVSTVVEFTAGYMDKIATSDTDSTTIFSTSSDNYWLFSGTTLSQNPALFTKIPFTTPPTSPWTAPSLGCGSFDGTTWRFMRDHVRYAKSVDGLNWTYSGGYDPVKATVAGNSIRQLDHINGLHIAVGSYAQLYTSWDGA
jgi:hypothetical protein